jgi:hypothetical protein
MGQIAKYFQTSFGKNHVLNIASINSLNTKVIQLSMFFPLMKTPGLDGFCDLMYQSPNNWENRIHKLVSIYLLWSDGQTWN